MKTLTIDKVGWKQLQGIIDVLVKAINRATPLKGDGISLSETDNGIIISIDLKALDASLNNMLEGKWINVDVMDENCNRSTITVWGKV